MTYTVTMHGTIEGVAVELTAGMEAPNSERAGELAAKMLQESEISEVRVVDVSPAGGPRQHPRRRPAGGDDIRRQKGGGQ